MSPSDFRVILEFPVQWGEMDAAGHVSNLVYLRWFESGRVEYFFRLGYDVVSPEPEGPGFILGRQDCKYLFPLIFPDTVAVGIKVTEIAEDRFTMHCRIWSQRHNRLACIANAVIVTYNYSTRKKMAVPAEMREKVEALEKGEL
jgi:acyl-CoA thioester hydrolase